MARGEENEFDEGLDRAVKVLMREFPEALFRLAELPLPEGPLRPEETAVNLPELRADHVFPLTGGKRKQAVYFEYQLHPDRRALPDWFCKCGALTRQLNCEVLLVVLYLEQGRYRSFPDRYLVSAGATVTEFRFRALRLWEHGERIRSGELAALAPLLPLCETHPDETILRDQRHLIHSLQASDAETADLLGLALLIGNRRFSRAVLERIFAEDIKMAKVSGMIGEWIEEGRTLGREEGVALGREEGVALGRAETAREFALRLLRERYPELPEGVVTRVRQEGVEWCEELAVRLVRGETLEDLGL